MRARRKPAPRVQHRVTAVDEVPIHLRIERFPEGNYVATSPHVPGLVAEVRSMVEAVEIAQGLARRIAECCIGHGDPLPPAFSRSAKRVVELTVPVGIR